MDFAQSVTGAVESLTHLKSKTGFSFELIAMTNIPTPWCNCLHKQNIGDLGSKVVWENKYWVIKTGKTGAYHIYCTRNLGKKKNSRTPATRVRNIY